MAPSPTPTPDVGSTAASETQAAPQASDSILASYSHRPLRREGARYFLSPPEQAVEDARGGPSLAPEPVLGKRTRQDDPPDGDDTEPDEGNSTSGTEPPSLSPSVSKVISATLRYASKKKLRPEQHDEVDAFLLVRTSLMAL